MNGEKQEPVGGKRPKGKGKRRRFVWWRAVLLLIILLSAVVLFVAWQEHAKFLRLVLPVLLERELEDSGYRLLAVDFEVRLGRPLAARNLVIGPGPEIPDGSRTRIEVESIELAPEKLRNLLRNRDRLFARLTVEGVHGVLDLRPEFVMEPKAEEEPAAPLDPEMLERWVPRLFPLRVEIEVPRFLAILEDAMFSVEGFGLQLIEGSSGQMRLEGGEVHVADKQWEFQPARGIAAWKAGSFFLFGFTPFADCTIRNFRADVLRADGPAISTELDLFGGWLRLDATAEFDKEPLPLDLRMWAGNLDIPRALAFLQMEEELLAEAGLEEAPRGLVRQLSASFRGSPEKLIDASAALRLEVKDVEIGERTLDSLVVGARLQNRSIELSEFQLDQEENKITASGTAAWPEDEDWTRLRFDAEVDARIPDVGKLADLAGEAFADTGGSIYLEGTVRSEDGSLSGGGRLRAKALRWKAQELGGVEAEALFAGYDAELKSLVWEFEDSHAKFHGKASLREPHVYSGEMELAIPDLGRFQELFVQAGLEEQIPAGGLKFFWQGDGTMQTHSGGFEFQAEHLHTKEFPAGLDATLAGTYSPDNVYLREGVLRHENLRLAWTLSAGKGGVHVAEIDLRAADKRYFGGQIYLPWNPFVLLDGGEWFDGILEGRQIYSDLQSVEFSLEEIAALAGQESPVTGRGRVQVRAAGTLDTPLIEAEVDLQDLESVGDSPQLLASRVEVRFESSDGEGRLAANAVVPHIDPVVANLRFPFGFRVTREGLEIEDVTGELEGIVRIPRTELSRFREFLPDARTLGGVLSGEILLGNSLMSPSISGRIELRDGALILDRQTPPVTDLRLNVLFDGDSFRIENSGGKVGAGPFEIRARGSFADLENPSVDLRVTGRDLLLARSRQIRLRANVDLGIVGSLQGGGAVTGNVELADGRFYQRLEITPLLQGAATEGTAPPLLPDLSGLVPPPLDDWRLDVRIRNASPFLVVGNVATGEVVPDIRVVGTLGDPRPTGEILLRDVRAYLPFSVVDIREGRVFLREESPRIPVLDIRGESEVLDYNILILAQGPLDDQNIAIRSDPPLPQESILLLLTAGLAPGGQHGEGLGEAAIGQGGLLLLKTLARYYERDGVDLDSLINRISVVSAPPIIQGQRSTLRAQFRVVDGWSIMSERDGLGYLGGGVSYSIRFR